MHLNQPFNIAPIWDTDLIPTSDPYRYWRILFTSTQGGSRVSLQRVELYESDIAANVAKDATVTASSQYVDGATTMLATNVTADSLTDDPTDATKRKIWTATGVSGEWIKFDFGAGNEKVITNVGLVARAHATDWNQSPKKFKVQYSDDNTNWRDQIDVSDSALTRADFRVYPGRASHAFANHTYWRLMDYQAVNPTLPMFIQEIEFRATVGGADQCSGGTPIYATQDTAFPGYQATRAFDNADSYPYRATAIGGYIGYQFASAVGVTEVYLRVSSGATESNAPRTMLVQFSDDGSHWTTAWELSIGTTGVWVTSPSGTNNNSTMTFSIGPVNITMVAQTAYVITGVPYTGLSLNQQTAYAILGSVNDGMTLNSQTAYVIVTP